METGLPDVQYERTSAPDGYVTTVLLPQGRPYDLVLVAKGTGQFRLTAHKIDDDRVTRTVVYDRVPLKLATTGTFAVTAEGGLGALRLDADGNGQNVRTVPVTAALSGDDRTDRTPPVTSLALSGTGGLAGYHTSDVGVTLSAGDGPQGTGVRLTQVRTDTGTAWSPYEGPFSLHEGCAPPLQYRSQDLNYNVETVQESTIKIDQVPPAVRSFTVSPAQLWPPNHALVEVTPSTNVTDYPLDRASTVLADRSLPWWVRQSVLNRLTHHPGSKEELFDLYFALAADVFENKPDLRGGESALKDWGDVLLWTERSAWTRASPVEYLEAKRRELKASMSAKAYPNLSRLIDELLKRQEYWERRGVHHPATPP